MLYDEERITRLHCDDCGWCTKLSWTAISDIATKLWRIIHIKGGATGPNIVNAGHQVTIETICGNLKKNKREGSQLFI